MSKAKNSMGGLMDGSEALSTGLKRDLKDAKFRQAFEAHYLEALIAEKMHALREQQHMTQKQLAHKAGMAQNAVSRIESGENSLTLRTIQRVAAALGYIVLVEFKPAKRRSLAVA